MIPKPVQERITAAIAAAEQHTTGEVRVYMEHRCRLVDPLHRAQELFAQLKMDQTPARNAILIYIALTDRQFALYGDEAIHQLAGGAAFWKSAAALLAGHLRKNELEQGLCNCIAELGRALAQHFPVTDGTKKNELPDDIVFGK